MTCPAEVMPVIVSPLTSSWENVAVASESFRSSTRMAPGTGPERSGRADERGWRATFYTTVTYRRVEVATSSLGPDFGSRRLTGGRPRAVLLFRRSLRRLHDP